MGSSPEQSGPNPQRTGLVVLFFLALAALGVFVWGGRPGQAPPAEAVQLPAVEQHRPVSRPAEPAEAMPQVAITPVARSNPPDSSGMYVAAARTDGHDHIWAHNPETGEHFQLTHGEWDDRDPAISPDLRTLAFSSNRTGNWDLLLMDLQSGNIRQLTDTPGFEGSPTWSPDSRWLAYEALYSDNFDIWILPIDGSQQAIQLTSHQSADHAPAWSPDGRKVAFTSDRTGLSDVYLADLDRPSAGFTNITNSAELVESVPAFDPLGDLLAYGVETSGLRGIQLMDLASGEPSWIGEGSSPAWIGDGEQVAAIALAPYGSRVVSYALREGGPKVSPVFAGRLSGLQWAPFLLPAYVVPGEMKSDLRPEAVLSNSTSAGGRLALIGLEDIAPAGLELSDSTDEAFYALRARAAELAGWDFLGQLDYAFVGVNDPLPPGFAYNDWLYTGRAFSVGQAALQAGWLEIVREDFGTTTYWRLFVRANSHEGDLGAPLKVRPWDLTARFSEDSTSYDSGGAPKAAVPSGYYIDFTALAADFGFERVPALSNWRSFFPGARTGEYVLREGLDWITAMKDLYPASAIETPAPYQTPTPTPTITPRPTATPWWWQWRTPTPTVPTATPTLTSTATPTP